MCENRWINFPHVVVMRTPIRGNKKKNVVWGLDVIRALQGCCPLANFLSRSRWRGRTVDTRPTSQKNGPRASVKRCNKCPFRPFPVQWELVSQIHMAMCMKPLEYHKGSSTSDYESRCIPSCLHPPHWISRQLVVRLINFDRDLSVYNYNAAQRDIVCERWQEERQWKGKTSSHAPMAKWKEEKIRARIV